MSKSAPVTADTQQIAQNTAAKKTSWRRVWQFVKPYRWVLLIAVLGVTLDAAVQGAFALLLQHILDDVFGRHDPFYIRVIPWAIVGLFLLRGIGNYIGTYGVNWVGRRVIMDIRERVFKKYLTLPAHFFDSHPAANLMARMTFDIEQMSLGVSRAVIVIARDFLTIIFLLAVMFYQSVELTLIVFAIVPLVAWIIAYVNKRFRQISHRIQQSVSGVSEVVEEVVRGQKEVRIYGGQEDELRRFNRVNNDNRRFNLKVVSIQAASSSLVQFLAACALAVIIYFATRPGQIDQITPGAFMSFISAMLALIPPLKRLSDISSTVQRTLAAADSVFYILDQASEKDSGDKPAPESGLSLRFNDVKLNYPDGTEALKGVNLDVPAGSVVALVGQSGSGKSSLVSLVPRFYDPTEGTVTINGTDIREYSLESLRDRMAYVGQNVVLFNDSVANNIAYGSPGQYSVEDIREAARKANALEFIENLPQGFDTAIGENGARLSGGQRQRLAIARAILKDAPILLLDEATSALDTRSERAIQEALQKVMKNRTTLVVAHRLSTIENADKVVVFDAGQVAEQGTHEELLLSGGLYAQLHALQHRHTDETALAVDPE